MNTKRLFFQDDAIPHLERNANGYRNIRKEETGKLLICLQLTNGINNFKADVKASLQDLPSCIHLNSKIMVYEGSTFHTGTKLEDLGFKAGDCCVLRQFPRNVLFGGAVKPCEFQGVT